MQPANEGIYKAMSDRKFIKMLCTFPDFVTFVLSAVKI